MKVVKQQITYRKAIKADCDKIVSLYSLASDGVADYGSGDPVLLPYAFLEEDNSYYISGMAVFADYQGNGIGSRLLEIAESNAIEHGLSKLSLIVFEQNIGAKKLYDKTGYVEIMRHPIVPHPIVPHPLIHFTGDALLMVKLLR